MASGIAHRLFMANITRICMTEIEKPLCVRRTVSFCEAVFEQEVEVEGVAGRLVRSRSELAGAWIQKKIGVIVDPSWKMVADLKPDVVVDAIMAKRNLGTYRNEAPLVIGVGPGFSAPDIVHVVVESNRGHDLRRAIYHGAAEPHTGMPGLTAGFSRERVLRSPHEGTVRHVKSIGNMVVKGGTVLYVDATPVPAGIDGIIRGLIREVWVRAHEKVGDIEPRGDISYSRTISDKARAIAGGVLEAVMHGFKSPGRLFPKQKIRKRQHESRRKNRGLRKLSRASKEPDQLRVDPRPEGRTSGNFTHRPTGLGTIPYEEEVMKKSVVGSFLALIIVLLLAATAMAVNIDLSAAAGLRHVIAELSNTFAKRNIDVTFRNNFGSSGALAKQVENGAPADLFISANPEWMDYFKEKKLVDEKGIATLAYNVLVFAGKPELKVARLQDTVRLQKIAIGSPRSVPCGRYTMEAFKSAGIERQVESKLVMCRDVRGCLLYAERGDVDGAFVYKTDIGEIAKGVKVLFVVPQDLYSRVTYPVGLTVAGSKKAEAVAFFRFLQSEETKAELARHGFLVK